MALRQIMEETIKAHQCDDLEVIHTSFLPNQASLNKLTTTIKEDFVNMVVGDVTKWEVWLDESNLHIFKDKTVDDNGLRQPNLAAVYSFLVKEKPRVVFQFLSDKNLELMWMGALPELPTEQLMVSSGNRTHFTSMVHYSKFGLYVVEEQILDEVVSFVISSVATPNLADALCWAHGLVYMKSFGFTIMPTKSGGVDAAECVITIATQQKINMKSKEEGMLFIKKLISYMTGKIRECLDLERMGSTEMVRAPLLEMPPKVPRAISRMRDVPAVPSAAVPSAAQENIVLNFSSHSVSGSAHYRRERKDWIERMRSSRNIDRSRLSDRGVKLDKKIEQLEYEIFGLAGVRSRSEIW